MLAFRYVQTFVLVSSCRCPLKNPRSASRHTGRTAACPRTFFAGRQIPVDGQRSFHVMWRACLLFSRPFSSSIRPLKEHSAYLAKLATRKPPPILLESDLEETFIKGTN